jgi:hypothetical protein
VRCSSVSSIRTGLARPTGGRSGGEPCSAQVEPPVQVVVIGSQVDRHVEGALETRRTQRSVGRLQRKSVVTVLAQPVARNYAQRAYPPFALQPDRAGGVLTEQGALADVATKHGRALVARLLGDYALWDTGSSSRGRKAGPQRVTGHLAGSSPARAAWRFNTSATAWPLSRVGPLWPWRSTGRKAAPSVMPETSSHARQARTGQVTGFDPKGMPSGAPGALLVRLRAPEANCEPVGPLCDVGHVEADQLAPAQRSREAEQEECPVPTPRGVAPSPWSIVRSSGTVSGRTWRWAVPRVLRTPRRTRRTASSLVGLSCPAARWAALIAARRRSIVAGLAALARSAT